MPVRDTGELSKPDCDMDTKYLKILMRPAEIRNLQSDVRRVLLKRFPSAPRRSAKSER